jgi:hypothetical protein
MMNMPRHQWRYRRRTHHLGIASFGWAGIKIQGERMDLTFAVGQTAQGIVQGLLADNVTPSGATLANLTYSFATSGIATAALDTTTPNAIDATAVAAGSTQLSFSATFTDTNGATGTASGTCNVTVTPGTGPAPLTTGLGINWSTPVGRKK